MIIESNKEEKRNKKGAKKKQNKTKPYSFKPHSDFMNKML